MQSQFFRILALSATPGNKMDNVHEVSNNSMLYIYIYLFLLEIHPKTIISLF